MSNSIQPNKSSCFSNFVQTLSDGLAKAYTPCKKWCMEELIEKCDRTGKKSLVEPCVNDTVMRKCMNGCRIWKYHSPLYRD